MIDHGFAFNGPHWCFQDSPIQGLYFRTMVYDQVRSLGSFQPWLEMVEHFPLEVIDSAWKEIPHNWLRGEEAELETVLEDLVKRRGRVPDLIQQMRRERANAFSNWK